MGVHSDSVDSDSAMPITRRPATAGLADVSVSRARLYSGVNTRVVLSPASIDAGPHRLLPQIERQGVPIAVETDLARILDGAHHRPPTVVPSMETG